MLSEDIAISGTGELPALIGVNDEVLGRLALTNRHSQGGDDQWSVE